MNNIVIGIEGLVGAGKTSISRELLKLIPNSILLHGGNLYRAIIYALMHCQQDNINITDLTKSVQNVDIKLLMDKLKVKFEIENRESVVYVDGKKIDENELQSKDNSLAVSIAGKEADNTQLFIFAKKLINNYKEKFNVIISGRDLMSIYPEIDYHFFITASLEERVRRKCIQYNETVNKKQIEDNIMKRDELQDKSGFYKKYEKTIEVDVTKCNDAKEGAEKILTYIN